MLYQQKKIKGTLIPFGYRQSKKDPKIVIPIPKQLNFLQKAIILHENGKSLQKCVDFIYENTSRKITRQGLYKIINKDNFLSREKEKLMEQRNYQRNKVLEAKRKLDSQRNKLYTKNKKLTEVKRKLRIDSKNEDNLSRIKLTYYESTPKCLDERKITEYYRKLISVLPYSHNLVIEHMYPRNPRNLKYSGLHTPNNIQILPKRLNSIKSDMDWKEWQDYLVTKDQEKTVSFFQYCIQELSKHNLKFKKVYNNNLKSWEYISCIDKSKLLMNNVDMFRKDI